MFLGPTTQQLWPLVSYELDFTSDLISHGFGEVLNVEDKKSSKSQNFTVEYVRFVTEIIVRSYI